MKAKYKEEYDMKIRTRRTLDDSNSTDVLKVLTFTNLLPKDYTPILILHRICCTQSLTGVVLVSLKPVPAQNQLFDSRLELLHAPSNINIDSHQCVLSFGVVLDI